MFYIKHYISVYIKHLLIDKLTFFFSCNYWIFLLHLSFDTEIPGLPRSNTTKVLVHVSHSMKELPKVIGNIFTMKGNISYQRNFFSSQNVKWNIHQTKSRAVLTP